MINVGTEDMVEVRGERERERERERKGVRGCECVIRVCVPVCREY